MFLCLIPVFLPPSLPGQAAAGLSVLPYAYPFGPAAAAAAAAGGAALPWMYQQPNMVQQQQQQQQQNGSVNGAVTPTQNGLKRPGSPSTNGANTPESVAAAAAAGAAAGLPNGAVPPNYMVPFFDPMRMANPAQVQAALAAAAAAANGMPPLRPVHPGAAAVSGAPLLIGNGQAGPGGGAGPSASVAPAGFPSPLGLGPQAQNSLGYGSNSNPLGGLSSRRDSADRAQPAFSPSLVEQYKNKAPGGQPAWPGPGYNPLGPLGLTAPSPPPGGGPGGTLGLFSGGGGGRFSTAPGSDRAFPGGGGAARNGGGLFGSSNNLFGGGGGHHGGKQRHSSIDKAASNRSKLLEDFR